jgi:hypothetical protein
VIAWEANPFSTKTFRRLVQIVLQPAEPAVTATKRRWYQFSLLGLLAMIAVLSAVFWLLMRLSIYFSVD